MENIADLLISFNEWWNTGAVRNDLKQVERRELFYKIIDYLENKQILSITGLRRTGKTTLIYQIIDHLISSGVDPKRILYFSFDELLSTKEVIDEVLNTYARTILNTPLVSKRPERVYVFFDEIQYVEKWQAILKRYYDLVLNIKFFVSGSASLHISARSKESLAGRIYDFVLDPMCFREFLELKGVGIKVKRGLDPSRVEGNYKTLRLRKEEITSLLNEYLLKGGFPETIAEESLEKIHTYIRSSVVDKVIFRDITNVFNVREPLALLEILKIAASNLGQIMEYESIGRALGLSRQTVSNYVFYLEQSNLIMVLKNYTKGYLSGVRKAKKFYIRDHGIINSLLGRTQDIFSENLIGGVFETVVANHLKAGYFWRERYEADFILELDGEIVPVEVKYRTDVRELGGLERCMKKFGSKRAIVVTKDLFKLGERILFVPAWLFLLVV
jgi:predicted AAA+ superfamily ATPase